MKNPFSFYAAATTDRSLAANGSTNGDSAVISIPNSSAYIATNGSTNGDSAVISIPNSSAYITTNGSTNGDSAGISIPKSSAYATLISGKYQHLLDKLNPHVLTRWTVFSILALMFIIHVYATPGFYVVCYVLGCYMLYLLSEFLVPANVENADDPVYPTTLSDGYRVFVRSLPEFKFWYSMTKALCIALVLTSFGHIDLPVSPDFLAMCWLAQLARTILTHVVHMVRHKYVPFSTGKPVATTRATAN